MVSRKLRRKQRLIFRKRKIRDIIRLILKKWMKKLSWFQQNSKGQDEALALSDSFVYI